MQETTLFSPHSQLSEFPDIPPHIISIILYRNKITCIPPLNNKIESLDLSDNLIKDISNVNQITSLKCLDVGYNLLSSISISLHNLNELYLLCNDINNIKCLDCPNLKKLDVGCNLINSLHHFKDLKNLEEFYVGNNKISKDLKYLKGLSKLKVLGVQNNFLEEVDCLDLPETLETLLLSENRKLRGLFNIQMLKNLKYLELYKTEINEIAGWDGLEIIYK